MSKVKNRNFHDVLEGDYLEPVRELKREKDKMEAALMEIKQKAAGYSDFGYKKIYKIADEALEEVDNRE